MYFPRPQAQPAAQPQAAPTPAAAPAAPQRPMGLPPIPNVSGFHNPITGQANNYAPIPPDEVKRWAELNHVSKGSVKQVEWSQNAGQYVFTMKDGSNERVSPQYIMQNQGHWSAHPDHANEAVKFMAASQAKRMMPQILSAMAARRGQAQQSAPQSAPAPMGPINLPPQEPQGNSVAPSMTS